MTTRGRPKSDDPRNHVVSVRLTAEEHDLCTTAADNVGLTLSNWMRTKAVAAAKRQKP